MIAMHIASPEDLLRALADDVARRRCRVYVPIYAASFRLAHDDVKYRELLQSTLNYPDGQGVVWALRQRGIPAERTATTDVSRQILELADHNRWSVYLYGGHPETLEAVERKVLAEYPRVSIVGTCDGYTEVTAVEVARLRPDVTFVARGSKLQEQWALDALGEFGRFGAGPILPCGGLFDFISGNKRRAPGWMQAMGLEWLFRTALEPRRLVRRYLVGNSWFAARYLLRRTPIEFIPAPTDSTPDGARRH